MTKDQRIAIYNVVVDHKRAFVNDLLLETSSSEQRWLEEIEWEASHT